MPQAVTTMTLEVPRPSSYSLAQALAESRRDSLPDKDPQMGTRGEVGEWESVYLPLKNGLSGGWRGFALDQELDAGDVVVFQLTAPSHFMVSAHVEVLLRVHTPQECTRLKSAHVEVLFRRLKSAHAR